MVVNLRQWLNAWRMDKAWFLTLTPPLLPVCMPLGKSKNLAKSQTLTWKMRLGAALIHTKLRVNGNCNYQHWLSTSSVTSIPRGPRLLLHFSPLWDMDLATLWEASQISSPLWTSLGTLTATVRVTRGKGGVVHRILTTPPKDAHILIPRAGEDVISHGQRDFAGGIK